MPNSAAASIEVLNPPSDEPCNFGCGAISSYLIWHSVRFEKVTISSYHVPFSRLYDICLFTTPGDAHTPGKRKKMFSTCDQQTMHSSSSPPFLRLISGCQNAFDSRTEHKKGFAGRGEEKISRSDASLGGCCISSRNCITILKRSNEKNDAV